MPVIVSSAWDTQAVTAIANKMPPDKATRWEIQSGHMFFKHRRATYHQHCITKCYTEMVGEMPKYFQKDELQEGLNSSYSGPLSELMLFHLDAYFEAERSGHDFILSCLRTAGLLMSAPSSFHDFYLSETKQPSKHSTKPPELAAELMKFWIGTGQPTKEYRDCLSHFASLSGPTWQHAVNMKWSGGSWTAALYLPDNPEAKSDTKFTFKHNLEALAVCTRLNYETNNMLRNVMKACAEKWGASTTTQDHRTTIRNVHIG